MKKIVISILALAQSGLASADVSTNAIYGDDNRHEPFEVDARIQELSLSVAGRIPKSLMMAQGGGFKLNGTTLGKRFCKKIRFSEQVLGPKCTGFLVSEDLLITAGHCMVESEDCTEHYWVFDLSLKTAGDVSYPFINGERVFQCREVVARKFDYFKNIDYTIIRLDRKVRDREPLTVDLASGLHEGLSVYTIGHPTGLPLKVTDSATILANGSPFVFETELDTFKGNSGSPVFDATTNQVIGIVSQGHADYVWDGDCKVPRVCTPENPCNRVQVSRSLNFKSDLEKALLRY